MSINDLERNAPLPTVLWEHQGEVEVIDYHLQTLDFSDESHDGADLLSDLHALEEADQQCAAALRPQLRGTGLGGGAVMRVHRNLHNAKAGGPQWVHTHKGKVAEYLDSVLLTEVTTRIQPAGQRKCQAAGVRSVCAFFDGTPGDDVQGLVAAIDDVLDVVDGSEWRRVSYDPRVDDGFLSYNPATGIKDHWNTAAAAHLRADGSTWVLNPRWEA